MQSKRTGLAMAMVAFGLWGTLAGCSSSCRQWVTPSPRYFAGGGWEIDYVAPAAGTAYLVEQNSHALLLTKSLEAGEHLTLDPEPVEALVKRAKCGSGPANPALYFVPQGAEAETPAVK
jgi:hypothetical protein